MKLSSAVQGFFLDKRSELATSTVSAYTYWFNHLAEHLQDPIFNEIQPAHIRHWFNHLLEERELSRRSVSDAWVPLSSLWTWAEAELGTQHIMKRVKRVSFEGKPKEPFTAEEIKRLLAGARYTTYERAGKSVRMKRAHADRDIAIILTLLDSGLRASELCNLTIADYDTERGRVYIREGKGGKEQILGHTTIEMSLHYARIAEVDLEKAGRTYSPADNWKLK